MAQICPALVLSPVSFPCHHGVYPSWKHAFSSAVPRRRASGSPLWYSRVERDNVSGKEITLLHARLATHRRAFLAQCVRAATFLVVGDATMKFSPYPARADRTGKYSTKLTAKKRYIPRIVNGFEALRSLGTGITKDGWQVNDEWKAQAQLFLDGPAGDMKYALPLFASSYFSDGNRVGPVEKQLKKIEDNLFTALQDLGNAVRSSNSSRIASSYRRAADIANEYIETAKLTAEVPLL